MSTPKKFLCIKGQHRVVMALAFPAESIRAKKSSGIPEDARRCSDFLEMHVRVIVRRSNTLVIMTNGKGTVIRTGRASLVIAKVNGVSLRSQSSDCSVYSAR